MTLSDFPRVKRNNNDPKQLGYWKLGRILGQGASGRVRIARHAKTGQMAAIKIIPKNLLTSRAEGLNLAGAEAERQEQSLRREVVLMKLIEHPNIMKLCDVWDLPDELFLVLEYVQGGELLEHLSKAIESGQKSIPLSQALVYFQQIILAVSYCHRFNVSHRDLKLENILVDSENNIKIADFGLASFQPDSIVRTACGSLHYCAPEVVTGYGNYNGPMADVWSCGIILFALLTCSLPFNPENDDELKEEILHAAIPFPTDLDPNAQDLISKMLTKDVQKRISMPEIQRHPFFLSEKPKITYGGIPSLEKIAVPLKSVDDIDLELLRSLRTLWREASDEEIKDSLVNPDRNWQKGAYYLLFEYRRKRLQEYDEQVAEIERKRMQKEVRARGEAKCAAKLLMEDTDMQSSPSTIPSHNGPPTPRRATRRGRHVETPSSPSFIPTRDGPPTPRRAARGGRARGPTSAASSDASFIPRERPSHLVPSTFTEDEIQPSLEQPSSFIPHSAVHTPSSLLPITVPDTEDPKVQAFYAQVLEHLSVLHAQTESPSPSNNHASFNPQSITSPNLALMQEIFEDRTMLGDLETPVQTPFAPLNLSSLPRDRIIEETCAASTPNSIRFPTRPLSLKRKETIQRPKRPTINTNLDPTNKENEPKQFLAPTYGGADVVKKSSLRKGGLHGAGKRVQIIDPGIPSDKPAKLKKKRSIRGPSSSPAPSSASTSLSSSSPFLSPMSTGSAWFANVFKFTRPEVYTLHSTHSVHVSRNECRRLLMEMDVRVILEDEKGLGVLKCRLDEVRDPNAIMTALKPVKFKVDVRQADKELFLILIHEKGSMDSFREVFKRLQREWVLDAVESRTPDQLLPSPSPLATRQMERSYHPYRNKCSTHEI
ncbi:kinase-like domain-containing protein [Lentinula aff. detonsa]|uniref:Kinase-like domain-containing protein n=1 Tax=Lentinula aff. detonsa TaxID=2804958 RepID=A0AA38NSR0_9AGAR|nr:kinase-like domain-containing protein [Lentinula aff. detonsa]